MAQSGINNYPLNHEAVNDPVTAEVLTITDVFQLTTAMFLTLQTVDSASGGMADGDFVVTEGRGGINLGVRRMQPAERLSWVLDYADWLLAGETVADVEFAATPATDPPLAVSGLIRATDNNESVTIFASDGVAGNTYKVETTMNTSTGRRRQDELYIVVYER